MSNWKIEGVNLVAPNQKVYPQESEANARAILAAIDEATAQRDSLQDEKTEAWLTAKEDAMLQAVHEIEDNAKKLAARMRAKKAMGERLP